jgi:hypothetical protein
MKSECRDHAYPLLRQDGRQPIRLAEPIVDHVNRRPARRVSGPVGNGGFLINNIALGFTVWLPADAIRNSRRSPAQPYPSTLRFTAAHYSPG